jgi:hypothetical protein
MSDLLENKKDKILQLKKAKETIPAFIIQEQLDGGQNHYSFDPIGC